MDCLLFEINAYDVYENTKYLKRKNIIYWYLKNKISFYFFYKILIITLIKIWFCIKFGLEIYINFYNYIKLIIRLINDNTKTYLKLPKNRIY